MDEFLNDTFFTHPARLDFLNAYHNLNHNHSAPSTTTSSSSFITSSQESGIIAPPPSPSLTSSSSTSSITSSQESGIVAPPPSPSLTALTAANLARHTAAYADYDSLPALYSDTDTAIASTRTASSRASSVFSHASCTTGCSAASLPRVQAFILAVANAPVLPPFMPLPLVPLAAWGWPLPVPAAPPVLLAPPVLVVPLVPAAPSSSDSSITFSTPSSSTATSIFSYTSSESSHS